MFLPKSSLIWFFSTLINRICIDLLTFLRIFVNFVANIIRVKNYTLHGYLRVIRAHAIPPARRQRLFPRSTGPDKCPKSSAQAAHLLTYTVSVPIILQHKLSRKLLSSAIHTCSRPEATTSRQDFTTTVQDTIIHT